MQHRVPAPEKCKVSKQWALFLGRNVPCDRARATEGGKMAAGMSDSTGQISGDPAPIS